MQFFSFTLSKHSFIVLIEKLKENEEAQNICKLRYIKESKKYIKEYITDDGAPLIAIKLMP